MKTPIALAVAMLPLMASHLLASEMLEVSLGYSQVIGPVAQMATVIVGDDAVADATLGGGGTIILTGRSIGATNLIVLDEAGRQLLSSPLHVVPLDRRPTTNVQVVRGASKAQNYVCGPDAGCSQVAEAAPTSSGPMVVIHGDGTGTTPEVPEAPAPPEAGSPAAQEQISLNP